MMWLMLQQEKPEDYVIATGEQHSVREFIDTAAADLGLTLDWQGEGVDEVGRVADFDQRRLIDLMERQTAGKNSATREAFFADVVAKLSNNPSLRPGAVIVGVDPRYFRPTEVETLLGNAAKSREKLGWRPRIDFSALVREMVEEDFAGARRDSLCLHAGFTVHETQE